MGQSKSVAAAPGPAITYKSTRGGVNNMTFKDAMLSGLCDDGGLFVPDRFPDFSGEVAKFQKMKFEDIAISVMVPFVGDSIPLKELKSIVKRSYSTFRHTERTPVVEKDGVHILELWHGPSFAFKDVALQFVGNVFEFFISQTDRPVTVLGATSGDTGSAAIYGLRGKKGVECFILYPNERVSRIQELQMTTVLDENIHNIAIDGDFDTAQSIVKDCFNDLEFKRKHNLAAVNSINFARILAQITYYIYAWSRVQNDPSKPVSFSVPTGNFGDVLAGYYAKRIGLPVSKLIVATNENDILYRYFCNGVYEKAALQQTISPSMDIQVSSNFERFLYAMADEDGEVIRGWMQTFSTTGRLEVTQKAFNRSKEVMCSHRCDKEASLALMKSFHENTGGYVLDPHTVIGVHGGRLEKEEGVPMVCLATAHPGKFGDAVKEALGTSFPLPDELAGLEGKDFRRGRTAGTAVAVKEFFEKKLLERGSTEAGA